MKKKYFLRGVGVGILVATMILATAYYALYNKPLSDAEIMERAQDLGMVTTESPLANLTKPDDTENTGITTTELVKPTETTAEEDTSTTESTTETTTTEQSSTEPTTVNPEPEPTTEAVTTEENTQEQTQGATKKITFTVVSGMNSYNVSKILADQGAVESADSFDSYLVSNGYANRISTGEYTVEVGEDYEAIAKKLVSGR